MNANLLTLSGSAAILAVFLSLASWGFGGGTGTPASARPDGERTWVRRADGTLQCGRDRAAAAEASLKRGEEQLAKAGVPVLARQKASDGKMRAQVCGAPTGGEDAYLVPRAAVKKAQALGFREGPAPAAR
jgi:hypothetical protein